MPAFNRTYADSMRHHGYGLALFEPISCNSLRPASVGFFGADGNWNLIAMLDDLNSVVRAGMRAPATQIEVMERNEASSSEPKVSSNVVQENGDFSAGQG